MKFKKNKKTIRLILIIIISLFLLTVLINRLRFSLNNFIAPTIRPAYTINTREPVAAEMFFTNEENSTSSTEIITKEIGRAQKTIEVAMYSLKSLEIKEALYLAASRGVKVTLILDGKKKAEHDSFLYDLPTGLGGIKRFDVGDEGGKQGDSLMHHKFALIDRGGPNQELIFGSFNWTELQQEYDRSFFLISRQKDLINSFGREFDRLIKSESGTKKFTDKKYHPWDLKLKAADYDYEVWFGPGKPGENIDYRVLDLLHEAKSEIKIMAWEFTDLSLAKQIVKRAQDGLKIYIVADSLNFYGKSSVFNYLLEAKKEYHLDTLNILLNDVSINNNYASASSSEAINHGLSDTEIVATEKIDTGVKSTKRIYPFLHHHLIIIDNQKVLFGTNNWSQGGSFFNDESAILTDDPEIIASFETSFKYNYSQGKVALPLNELLTP